MARNSFRVKNSFNLTPVDLTTIVAPEAGDIACDINDGSKIKSYNAIAAAWEEVGGGGTGGINYIDNSDAEAGTTGYATYADAAAAAPVDGTGGTPAVTFTATTTTPLRGTRSFLLSKGALNEQGEGVAAAFTIDPADRASILRVSFDYSSTTNYLDGDVCVYVYDITNSRLIEVVDRDVRANAQGKYVGTFQSSPDSVSYRLILHVASTNDLAWDLEFDNVIVGPREIVRGPVMTDWQAFTPTGSWGPVTYTGSFRRIGDSIEVQYRGVLTGVPTGALSVQLPSGLTFDGAKINNGSTSCIQDASYFDQSSGAVYGGASYLSGSSIVTRNWNTAGANLTHLDTSATSPISFAAGDEFHIRVVAPILGWSSNATLSEDAGNREIVSYGGVVTPQEINTTATNVTFGQVVSTTASFDGTTFTVPETGYYDISATGLLEVPAFTSPTNVQYSVVVNGVISYICQTQVERVGFVSVPPITNTVRLSKGSTVTVQALKETNNATVRFNGDARYTRFNISKRSSPQTIAASEVVACRYTSNAGQSIPNATQTTLIYEDREYDTHNAYSPSTGTFTAPQSGYYTFNASLLFSSQSWGADTLVELYTVTGSTATVLDSDYLTAGGTFFRGVKGSTTHYIPKGVTYQLRVFQNRGAATPVEANPAFVYLSITKVG